MTSVVNYYILYKLVAGENIIGAQIVIQLVSNNEDITAPKQIFTLITLTKKDAQELLQQKQGQAWAPICDTHN